MLEQGLHRFSIHDSQTGEVVELLRPVPQKGDAWGVLRCIAETPVGKEIPVVSGYDMSQALHGRFMPFRRSLGREPRYQLKKFTTGMLCSQFGQCLIADKAVCFPNPKMPHCYSPPGFSGLGAQAVATVLQAWASGRYVAVVQGDEFSWL